MRILVKFPSKSRPQKAINIIESYTRMADAPITIVVTYDYDDTTMNNNTMKGKMSTYPNVIYMEGSSSSKIHAINRDLYKLPEYDILVNASDDMECQMQGWDTILKMEMATHFPELDGVLFHWDGDPNTKGKLNTMCIMGRKAVERFAYIYNPNYVSLWCDNEFTEVWDKLGKQFRSDVVLFKHVHFSNTPGLDPDPLMKKTQSYYHVDESTFKKRKAINFGL